MFFAQQQQQHRQLEQIIRRVKTALSYRDQYGRPVQVTIGGTDVIPLAQAAHALRAPIPPDLMEVQGRPKQFPVAAVSKLLHNLEVAMYSAGIPLVQVAPAGQQADFGPPPSLEPVYRNQDLSQQPPVATFTPPPPPVSPWPEGPTYQDTQRHLAPVTPTAMEVMMQQMQAMQQQIQQLVAMQANTARQPQYPAYAPPPVDNLSIQQQQLGLMPVQDQGETHRPLTVAQQLGLVPADQAIPPLGQVPYEQLREAATEGITVPPPPRTPEGVTPEGKTEASATPAEAAPVEAPQEAEPASQPAKKRGRPPIQVPQSPASRYPLMNLKQLETAAYERGLTVPAGANKAVLVEHLLAHDRKTASEIVATL